jgi:hypothetical protein
LKRPTPYGAAVWRPAVDDVDFPVADTLGALSQLFCLGAIAPDDPMQQIQERCIRGKIIWRNRVAGFLPRPKDGANQQFGRQSLALDNRS